MVVSRNRIAERISEEFKVTAEAVVTADPSIAAATSTSRIVEIHTHTGSTAAAGESVATVEDIDTGKRSELVSMSDIVVSSIPLPVGSVVLGGVPVVYGYIADSIVLLVYLEDLDAMSLARETAVDIDIEGVGTLVATVEGIEPTLDARAIESVPVRVRPTDHAAAEALELVPGLTLSVSLRIEP